MITNPTDLKLLRALIGALAEVDALEPDEQQQLTKIAEKLAQNSKSAIGELHKFAKNSPSLQKLYQEACQGLQGKEHQKNRTKVISLTIQEDTPNREVDNISLSNDALSQDPFQLLQELLPAKSSELAKQVKTQIIDNNQLKDENSESKPWWHWLGYLFSPYEPN